MEISESERGLRSSPRRLANQIGRVREKEMLKGYHRRVRKGDYYEVHVRFLRNEVDKHEHDDWLVATSQSS